MDWRSSEVLAWVRRLRQARFDLRRLRQRMPLSQALDLVWQLHGKKSEILRFAHRGVPLCVNREKASVIHIIRSVPKLEALAATVPLPAGAVVVDVGANTGVFARFVKERYPDAELHLFEPSTDLKACIEENLARFTAVRLHTEAVTDRTGDRIEFFVNPDSQQTNSLIAEAVTDFGERCERRLVETICLDDFVSREGIDRIDLLKVDVQGAESAVVDGATRALKLTQNAIFELTFLDPRVGETLAKLESEFPARRQAGDVYGGADVLFYRPS